MYSFVVLGQIPGTSITISFTMWVQLALIIAAAAIWYQYVHKHNHATEKHHTIMVMRNGQYFMVDEISL